MQPLRLPVWVVTATTLLAISVQPLYGFAACCCRGPSDLAEGQATAEQINQSCCAKADSTHKGEPGKCEPVTSETRDCRSAHNPHECRFCERTAFGMEPAVTITDSPAPFFLVATESFDWLGDQSILPLVTSEAGAFLGKPPQSVLCVWRN